MTPKEAKAAGRNGDFGPLVALVRGGSEGGKQAAGALKNLANGNADNQEAMLRVGYTP